MFRASFGDYWSADDDRPIHLKKASVVFKVLQSLGSQVYNHRVDVLTDSTCLAEGVKDRRLNDIMKSIFQFIRHGNIELHLDYIPTQLNPADAPTRRKMWNFVDMYYGPHSVDLMATDANVMLSTNGQPSKHYTLFPSPLSSGSKRFRPTPVLEGDRASDACYILAQEVKLLPDETGHVFHHNFGKTLRGVGKSNTFVIKRCIDAILSPVLALEMYQAKARELGVTLANGFLFRPVSDTGVVLDIRLS
ncbi:hypothetical protein KUTeg_004085 [Tegillarca granosa]|uniref:Uncharacterized protein n=1 Tax=Tegillarca granosa TaxID=220873 RepID=A0ABQ9FNW7_TEGGR|nr:hypothetical protein KUTeg_004085 [Tegillarca granosa]